jgi:hypothetical protein
VGSEPDGGGAARAATGVQPGTLDAALVLARLRELNALAGEGAAKVVRQGREAQLRVPDPLPLTLFRDGFMLRRGPFRTYADASSQAFFRDVLDGFFPSELRDEFPEGVVFDVRDRTAKAEAAADGADGGGSGAPASAAFAAFSGEGRALRTDDDAGGAPGRVRSLADLGDPTFSLDSREFLSALPERVIRGGKVVAVRGPVADMLKAGGGATTAAAEGGPPAVVVVDTPVVRALRAADDPAGGGPAADGAASPLTPHDVTTLQVRSDSGRQVLVVKLRFDDTVGDLRRFVDVHRAKSSPYELRTAFPARSYTDNSQSLRDAGLVPNATLIVRALA